DAVPIDRVVGEKALDVVHADAPVLRGRKFLRGKVQDVSVLAAQRLAVGIDTRKRVEDLAGDIPPDVAEAHTSALQPVVEARDVLVPDGPGPAGLGREDRAGPVRGDGLPVERGACQSSDRRRIELLELKSLLERDSDLPELSGE